MSSVRSYLFYPFLPFFTVFLEDKRGFFPLKCSPLLRRIQIFFSFFPVFVASWAASREAAPLRLFTDINHRGIPWEKMSGRLQMPETQEWLRKGRMISLPSTRMSPFFFRLFNSRVTVSRVAPMRLAISWWDSLIVIFLPF